MAADSAPGFPSARNGYQRSSVDRYLLDLTRRLDEAYRDTAGLTAETRRLQRLLETLQTAHSRLQSATVEERAQDLLDAAQARADTVVGEAERRAAELRWQSERDAEVLMERARQEQAWRRRQLQGERVELLRQQQALRDQLRSLRALTSGSLPPLADSVTASSDQELYGQHLQRQEVSSAQETSSNQASSDQAPSADQARVGALPVHRRDPAAQHV